MITKARGKMPTIENDVYISDSADIVGDVHIGEGSSIWFKSVLRGDVMPITIGKETNVQDGSIIHGTYNKAATVLGDRVTIGHGVILHGCRVDNKCLIGMGSIIMDMAHIGENSIVGAGSLVTENTICPPGHLMLGRPAKVIRPLKQEELDFLDKSADNYIKYKSWYEDKGNK